MRVFYTDGSASPNPGPGGYAVIEGGKPVALGSEDGETTNIRMEAHALLAALTLAAGKECEIHTDSEFWINVLTKWAPGWKANGWSKKTRGEIQNLELVKELYELYTASPKAKLVWVRGHDGNAVNELADEWANKARKGERL
ncbi:MAG: ribonuclease HI [Candidatus Nomurabacteria bacterium]|jgi:ribonuclease HI|nr:ribonuclease HI [Candidatus Nomurabacteria bacterium]